MCNIIMSPGIFHLSCDVTKMAWQWLPSKWAQTGIKFLIVVSSQMPFKTSCFTERFYTYGTTVRFFFSMISVMPKKTSWLREWFGAQWTGVWFFSCERILRCFFNSHNSENDFLHTAWVRVWFFIFPAWENV